MGLLLALTYASGSAGVQGDSWLSEESQSWFTDDGLEWTAESL